MHCCGARRRIFYFTVIQVFDGTLVDMLMTHKLYIVGHSHSGEPIPRPSGNDREALEVIGQEKSTVISAMSGMCIDFSADSFEIW